MKPTFSTLNRRRFIRSSAALGLLAGLQRIVPAYAFEDTGLQPKAGGDSDANAIDLLIRIRISRGLRLQAGVLKSVSRHDALKPRQHPECCGRPDEPATSECWECWLHNWVGSGLHFLLVNSFVSFTPATSARRASGRIAATSPFPPRRTPSPRRQRCAARMRR